MKVSRTNGRPSVELILVTVITLAFTTICISFEFLESIYSFVRYNFSMMTARFLSNFVFLYLAGLLWVTYYRWRKASRRNKELESVISSISPDVLLVVNKRGEITMCNNGVERMFGYRVEDIMHGKPDLLHDDAESYPERWRQTYEALEKEGFHVGVARGKKKNGDTMPLEIITGKLSDGSGAVLLLRDITERMRMEEELQIRSTTDELTGLCNRRGFLSLFQQQLRLSERHGRGLLLFFIDLDGMKSINDTFGHAEGDHALVWTAELLRKTFRSSDIIARMGGDEFAVVAVEAEPSCVEIMMERLTGNLQVINSLSNRSYSLRFSIGVTYYDPAEPLTIDEMLKRADAAMYEDKESKKMPGVGPKEASYVKEYAL